jgi:hypothetical protein
MPANLSHVIGDFSSKIASSQRLLVVLRTTSLRNLQIELVAELAFLRVFIGWENFLEESFLRYMVKSPSPSGYSPRLLTSARTLDHALRLVLSGRPYFSWSSVDQVIKTANLYFENGEPFAGVLQSAMTDLTDMRTIRNRITHRSPLAREQFTSFIRRKFGHGKKGMTSGRFLQTLSTNDPSITFMDYYISVLKAASQMIIR